VHVAISWDITADGERWKQVDERMRAAIQRYPWVRPLSTFYVVQISSESDRNLLQDSLVAVAKSAGVTVHFLITPAMLGGQYQGYVPVDHWSKINARTT
jgi:hypothetical protein